MKLRVVFSAVLLTAAAWATTGCGEDAEARRRAELRTEIIQIHDAAMPEMSRIGTLQGVLRHFADSLRTKAVEGDTSAISRTLSEVDAAHQALDDARNAMNSWMEGYNANLAEQESDSATAYLLRERDAAVVMRETFNNGLRKAEDAIRKYELPMPPQVVQIKADTSGAASDSHAGH